jgi:hypothetical protein
VEEAATRLMEAVEATLLTEAGVADLRTPAEDREAAIRAKVAAVIRAKAAAVKQRQDDD